MSRRRSKETDRAERQGFPLEKIFRRRLERVRLVVAEANLRRRLVACVAGAAVGLDVRHSDGPDQIAGSEAFLLEHTERQRLEFVILPRVHFNERNDRANVIAVAELDCGRGFRLMIAPVLSST